MQLSEGFSSIPHQIFLRDKHVTSISRSLLGPFLVLYSLYIPCFHIHLFIKKPTPLSPLLSSVIYHCTNSSLFTKLASNASCAIKVRFCLSAIGRSQCRGHFMEASQTSGTEKYCLLVFADHFVLRTQSRMKHLKYPTLVFWWEISTIISGFLFPPDPFEYETLVSLEKTGHNITMYCHAAHLERQDCNLCAGPDF